MTIRRNYNKGFIGSGDISVRGVRDLNQIYPPYVDNIYYEVNTGDRIRTSANTVSGDFLLLFATRSGGNSVGTIPVGWTEVLDITTTPETKVAYKISDGGENAANLSLNSSQIVVFTIKGLLSPRTYDTSSVSTANGGDTMSLTTGNSGVLFMISAIQNEDTTITTAPDNMDFIVETAYEGSIQVAAYCMESKPTTSYTKTITWAASGRSTTTVLINVV